MKRLFRFDSQPLRNFAVHHWGKLLAVQIIVLVGLGYALASWSGGRANARTESASASINVEQVDEGPSMWTCSMHPQIRQPNPGDCPICGMDLIPVAKTAGGMRTLTIGPEARALMNIETAPVERRYVPHTIRMVGKVGYDETKLGYITAWVPGRLDRLFVDYTGVEVKEGDHMAYIYSEDLYAAQEELIRSARFAQNRADKGIISGVDLLEASRDKLRLLGLKEEQIEKIEDQDKPSTHLTLYAPVSGVVIEKLKQEGERVKLGDRIYTIANLNLVWIHLDAYESDLPWIRYGQNVTITTEAYPGDKFHGRIAFIQPVLDDKTRTVKVRVNVPNVDGKLKPEMFVRATVHPMVAAGGRVMDPSVAGKWICPMHPEIVKDESGDCDICGMPLVRAESLGYVTAEEDRPPLVVPYSAVLPTGTRAVVYVELPEMPSFAEPAFQTLSAAVEGEELGKIRDAFVAYSRTLDQAYDHAATQYAKDLWNGFADRLGRHALAGQRGKTVEKARRIFAQMEAIMNEAREEFAPPGQPTFEGREILLGPRAGDFYLVRHGLQEGELVVRQGNFKIDAEIQIQAKPSMMTPEGGGGGGGHQHGDGDGKQAADTGERGADHVMLPPDFQGDVRDLYAAYEEITKAVDASDLGKITAAFDSFGKTLSEVDGGQLTGHPRMLWKELSMLLGNDAVEGQEVKQMDEADRVYLLFKNHMRRLRQQLGVSAAAPPREAERIAVPREFQSELARAWERYLAVGKALALDDFNTAQESLGQLQSAVATIDPESLKDSAAEKQWHEEHATLVKLVEELKKAGNIEAMREAFRPLSNEIGFLAKSFGFGEARPIYELHCPMAFGGQGAVWYQEDETVRNPYYGATMLKCADRVERVVHDEPANGRESPPHDASHGEGGNGGKQ